MRFYFRLSAFAKVGAKEDDAKLRRDVGEPYKIVELRRFFYDAEHRHKHEEIGNEEKEHAEHEKTPQPAVAVSVGKLAAEIEADENEICRKRQKHALHFAGNNKHKSREQYKCRGGKQDACRKAAVYQAVALASACSYKAEGVQNMREDEKRRAGVGRCRTDAEYIRHENIRNR